MRPLRAASDVNRSGNDLDLSRILKPDCFTFIAFLCFAESITRLDWELGGKPRSRVCGGVLGGGDDFFFFFLWAPEGSASY